MFPTPMSLMCKEVYTPMSSYSISLYLIFKKCTDNEISPCYDSSAIAAGTQFRYDQTA